MSNKIKLSVAALLFGIAIILHFSLDSEKKIPETEETKTAWFCTPCDHGFQLSGSEMTEKISVGRVDRPSDEEASEPQIPRRRRMIKVAQCPVCKEWSGEAARRCPDCGHIFSAKTKEGQPAVCPNCQWDPLP
ncbi:MAG: hypothetical protein MI923_19305 [Phycisphaerales bacterium]|nr:hypothetical protein [Phycisphaerales bacterium]